MTSSTAVSISGGKPDRVWQPGEFVYLDPTSGQGISTHSMMKTFKRCPKQFEYKYIQRLKPKIMGRPLRFGTWMHALLETYYKGGDVEATHAIYTSKFNKMFDEEKLDLGDLPRDVWRTYQSYLWHYKADPWKIHEVEFTLEVELPDGCLYRGRIDMLIENEWGLWIVDHKNHKTLPGLDFRLLDAQSALYVWAALKNKIPVQGHIWNYLISKPPSIPVLLKDGTRLSKSKIDTDYPTFVRALKKYELDPAPYMDQLRYLKAMRYQPGVMQHSTHFRRDILEKSPQLLKKIASEAFHTHVRMNAYRWEKTIAVERNVDRSCTFMCSYRDLCTTELFGGDTRKIRKERFEEVDPNYYYYDEAQETDGSKE